MMPDAMDQDRCLQPALVKAERVDGKSTAPYRASAPDTIDIMPNFTKNRPTVKPCLDLSVPEPVDRPPKNRPTAKPCLDLSEPCLDLSVPELRAPPTKSQPADANEDDDDAHGDLLGATADTEALPKGVERVPMMAMVPSVLPRTWTHEAKPQGPDGGEDADDANGDLLGAAADTDALCKDVERVPMMATVPSVDPRTWTREANTTIKRQAPNGSEDTDDADKEGATADNDALGNDAERVPSMATVRSILPWTWTQEASILMGPLDKAGGEGLTTLMIRNLPPTLWPRVLMQDVDESGFAGLYDVLYMPMHLGTRRSKGFAFINFMSESAARKFLRVWHQSDVYYPEVISVVFATSQGKRANIQRMLKAKALRISNADMKPFVRDFNM